MGSLPAGALEAVWHIECARLIAGLARFTGDVGLAEELAQDAWLVALEQWPVGRMPPNPGGWLMTTAKRRAIDGFRRSAVQQRAVQLLGRDLQDAVLDEDRIAQDVDGPIGDEILRLLFTACHPVLSRDARVALTLRCLTGLRTDEIARAFLLPESTVGQRISRAKKTLRDRGIRFEIPGAADLPDRLAAVLEVIYLVFNEGYSATAGQNWMRPDLAAEAVRLARSTASLLPGEGEVQGLVALLELTESRAAARTGPDGRPVLLQDQDRRRWDRLLIQRGLQALDRAHSGSAPVGRYTLQASIAACHATAPTAAETDWARIAALYDVLLAIWPTPVVELNRAMAHGRAVGPDAGLRLLDRLDASALARYPQLPAVRGELLALARRPLQAAEQFQVAARLTRNDQERWLFAGRADALAGPDAESAASAEGSCGNGRSSVGHASRSDQRG